MPPTVNATVEPSTRVDQLWHLLTHQHPDPDSPKQVRAAQRLTTYENKTAWTMVALSIVYLVLYSFYVLEPDLNASQRSFLNSGMNIIWVIFIVDLLTRALLAPRSIAYLVHHPIDVIAVAIPALRVLRVLRVLTAGQWLISRGSRLRFGRTATAVVIAFIFVTYLASLAVLNAERGAPGAKIETFPDSLWWSIVTMSTVGYGEYYPVTTSGRIIAAGVMVVGISLLGLVGASVASSVVSRLSGQAQQGQDEIRVQIRQLTQEIAGLRQQLADARVITPPAPAGDPSDGQHAQPPSDPSSS
jgi:voltage-gated potassium channel